MSCRLCYFKCSKVFIFWYFRYSVPYFNWLFTFIFRYWMFSWKEKKIDTLCFSIIKSYIFLNQGHKYISISVFHNYIMLFLLMFLLLVNLMKKMNIYSIYSWSREVQEEKYIYVRRLLLLLKFSLWILFQLFLPAIYVFLFY